MAPGGRLLDPGDPNVSPDSYGHVDGLQANSFGLVRSKNTTASALLQPKLKLPL